MNSKELQEIKERFTLICAENVWCGADKGWIDHKFHELISTIKAQAKELERTHIAHANFRKLLVEQGNEKEQLRKRCESAEKLMFQHSDENLLLRNQLQKAVKALEYAHRFAKRDDLYDAAYVDEAISHIQGKT